MTAPSSPRRVARSDEYLAEVAASMRESVLQARVEQLATLLGWKAYHTHDSRRSQAGFPDLTLVKDGRLIFAELKSAKGGPTPEQNRWLAALAQVPGIETYLWRPLDLLQDRILAVLQGHTEDGAE